MKAIFRRGHADHNTKAQKHASAAPSHSGAHITHPSHASSPAIAAVTLASSGGASGAASTTTTTTSSSSSSPTPARLRDASREPLGGAHFLNYKPSAPVFGVPLTEVVEREGRDLPAIAELSMAYLDRYGLKLEGIFRIPGNTINVDNLKLYFDGAGDYSLEVCDDVHAVAGLLKLYLRELPEPLLTHRFYDTFIAVQKNPDVNYRMTNLRKLVCALPPAHKRLLTSLLGFLLRVADNVGVNKMTLPNLAIVFGPNILRPRHESMLRMIEDARFVNGVLKTLLEEYEFLVTNTTSRPKLGGSQVAVVEEPKEDDTAISSSILNYTGPAGGRRKARMGAIKFDPSQIEELGGGEQGELPAKSVKEFLQVTHGRTRIASVHLDVPPVIEVNGELKPIDSPSRSPQSQAQHRLASPSAPASLSAEAGFDLTRPLEYCNQILTQLRTAQGRPDDLAAMTPAQLKDEKVIVKRLLRQFDAAFKEKHGKLPSKPQKEPLRPLYMRYRELTKLVVEPDDDFLTTTTTTAVAAAASTPTGQPPRVDSPKPAPASPKILSTSGDGAVPPGSPILESKEYKAMKREKRKLQLQLHQYQNEFIARHGRKVQYLEDRLPVQNEYERYKELKASLAAMEQQAQQGR